MSAGGLDMSVATGSTGVLAGVAHAGMFGGGSGSGRAEPGPTTPLATGATPVLSADQLDGRAAAVRASRSMARTKLRREQVAARLRFLDRTVLPVEHYRLSAGFGDVSWLWSHAHTGQDFVVPEGTPVHAVRRGVVTHAGWAGAYGYRLTIRHPDGVVSFYCHLSRLLVHRGPVAAGQVVARSGNTGNSTGAHLHFEVRPDGKHPADPIPWLRRRGLHPRAAG